MQVLLANSYFHRGHDHLLGFIFARTFGVLQYTFGQLAVGDIAGTSLCCRALCFCGGEKDYERKARGPILPAVRSVADAALRDQRRDCARGSVSVRGNATFSIPRSLRDSRCQPGDCKIGAPEAGCALSLTDSTGYRLPGFWNTSSSVYSPRRSAAQQHDAGHEAIRQNVSARM